MYTMVTLMVEDNDIMVSPFLYETAADAVNAWAKEMESEFSEDADALIAIKNAMGEVQEEVEGNCNAFNIEFGDELVMFTKLKPANTK